MQLWSLPIIGYHPIDLDGLVEGVHNIAPRQGMNTARRPRTARMVAISTCTCPSKAQHQPWQPKTYKNGIPRSCEYWQKQVIFDGKRRVATLISQYYC